jgi:hypothetical protein
MKYRKNEIYASRDYMPSQKPIEKVKVQMIKNSVCLDSRANVAIVGR